MSARHHLLRAAFAGAVLLGVYFGLPKPVDGHPAHTSYRQLATLSSATIDRTDVPWQASATKDPDQIRAF